MVKKTVPLASLSGPLPLPSSPPTAEEMSFLEFLEARGNVLGLDPVSDEGLRLQALYVLHFSQHPMDVIQRIMSNPLTDTKDRIASAKILMEYSMRKPTQDMNVELTGKDGGAIQVASMKLKGLSDVDLAAVKALLTKS